MNYQDLFTAHYAFYAVEIRANHYDSYLKTKNEELWRSPEPPASEIGFCQVFG
jgi:hypothetical protein